MKIAVMGAGGVGGYFGARLAADGNDVAFIARGRHLQAIRDNGLKVLSENGDVLVHPATATDNPAGVGPVDVVMFCVKLWDTEAAAEQIRPMIGPNTAVVSFQNGVYAEQKI
ncbi:MAG: 2-dehydropantoate 2-reductase, partial [Minwuiales bacterium]|nr:2-dehydropantoate 2-reductase [Minwuiales bacterium]